MWKIVAVVIAVALGLPAGALAQETGKAATVGGGPIRPRIGLEGLGGTLAFVYDESVERYGVIGGAARFHLSPKGVGGDLERSRISCSVADCFARAGAHGLVLTPTQNPVMRAALGCGHS
jgi:hypothetical protein